MSGVSEVLSRIASVFFTELLWREKYLFEWLFCALVVAVTFSVRNVVSWTLRYEPKVRTLVLCVT